MSSLKIVVPLFLIGLIVDGSLGDTRFLTRTNNSASGLFKTRNNNFRTSQEPIAVTKSPLQEANSRFDDAASNGQDKSQFQRRNLFVETSTFNPDVLNKFLEEYATKMKSSSEKTYKYPFTVLDHPVERFQLGIRDSVAEETKANRNKNTSNGFTTTRTVNKNDAVLELDRTRGDENSNDTLERNKNRGSTPYDDRNGWVTLEAIPWSKSKISKWQANQDPQKPWPEHKPWEKPQSVEKPWPERPGPSYEEDVPWYEKPKPYYPENPSNQRPWYEADRPKPSKPSRPSYFDDNEFNERPSYAQKWPPEKPWDKFSNSYKESPDIITDNKPTNFPGNWEKPQISKPSYSFDRFSDNNRDQNKNDWKTQNYNFPSKYEEPNNRPSNFPKPSSSLDRPHFSHYQYSTDHPPTHPANGDGEWILLSTNRGYSKSRQRSIKMEVTDSKRQANSNVNTEDNGENAPVAMMSSKRQIRLTVLPSVNGTNTTTSHGGLLEVEKTFKTVDQSQKEYEREKLAPVPSVLTKRPIRNTGVKQPSNSAVLAAVGAGMLPATMAMVIPMMLGRKRRSLASDELENTLKKSSILELNDDFIKSLNDRGKLRKLRM